MVYLTQQYQIKAISFVKIYSHFQENLKVYRTITSFLQLLSCLQINKHSFLHSANDSMSITLNSYGWALVSVDTKLTIKIQTALLTPLLTAASAWQTSSWWQAAKGYLPLHSAFTLQQGQKASAKWITHNARMILSQITFCVLYPLDNEHFCHSARHNVRHLFVLVLGNTLWMQHTMNAAHLNFHEFFFCAFGRVIQCRYSNHI